MVHRKLFRNKRDADEFAKDKKRAGYRVKRQKVAATLTERGKTRKKNLYYVFYSKK